MAQTVLLKRSSVAGKVPVLTDVPELGSVALNTNDARLYARRDDGTPAIVEIGGYRPLMECDQTIAANYTLPTGRHALSMISTAIAAGVTVTIPANSTWRILD